MSNLLYHGSDLVVEKPRVLQPKYPLDFGDGFYLTRYKEQAERWAILKSKRNKTYTPIVNIYELNYDKVIDILKPKYFSSPDSEWLHFIANSRSGKQNDYNYIEGPIADDQIYNFVEQFLIGELNEKEFMQKAKYNKLTNQIVLSGDIIDCLIFVDSYEVDYHE